MIGGNNSSFLLVGDGGAGTLGFTNGGLVSDSCPTTCTAANIAFPGSQEPCASQGRGLRGKAARAALIGAHGNGTLTIDTDGQVSTGTLRVGTQPGSYGIVTIDSGGQLTNTKRGSIGEVAVCTRQSDRLLVPNGRSQPTFMCRLCRPRHRKAQSPAAAK